MHHPVGYIGAKDANFEKCVTFLFLTKHVFQKYISMYPVLMILGYLGTPHVVGHVRGPYLHPPPQHSPKAT